MIHLVISMGYQLELRVIMTCIKNVILHDKVQPSVFVVGPH